MALSSGAQIYDFAGDNVHAVDLSADLVDGGVAGGSNIWPNTEKAPRGKAVLYLPNGCTGGAWEDAPQVHLWGIRQNVEGINDETPEPSASDTVGAQWLGSFLLDDHATPGTPQRRALQFDTEGLGWKCWIENDTGRTLDYVSTNIEVDIEGASIIAKA